MVTKPTYDSPPRGLNWAQPPAKGADSSGDEKPAPARESDPGSVKGVFDTARLLEAPPPVGLKGAARIPEPQSEANASDRTEAPASAMSRARIELAEMISGPIEKDSQPPLATFVPGKRADSGESKPLVLIKKNVRGVFGGDREAEREEQKPAQTETQAKTPVGKPAPAQTKAPAGEQEQAQVQMQAQAPPDPSPALPDDAAAGGARREPDVRPSAATAAPVEPISDDNEADEDLVTEAEAALQPAEMPVEKAVYASSELLVEVDIDELRLVSDQPPPLAYAVEPGAEPEGEPLVLPLEKTGRVFLRAALALLALAAGTGAAVVTGIVQLPPDLLPFGLLSSAAPAGPPQPMRAAPLREATGSASARQPAATAAVPTPQSAAAGPAAAAEARKRKTPPSEQRLAAETEQPARAAKGSTGPDTEPEGPEAGASAAPGEAKSVPAAAVGADPEAGDDSAPPAAVTEDNWKSMLRKAEKLQRRGDDGSAEPIFRAVLRLKPDEHHAMEGLAKILLKRNAGSEALPLTERIVRKRSKRASYRLLYGDALAQTGDQAKAVEQWQKAVRLSPSNTAARNRLRNAGAEESSEAPAAAE